MHVEHFGAVLEDVSENLDLKGIVVTSWWGKSAKIYMVLNENKVVQGFLEACFLH